MLRGGSAANYVSQKFFRYPRESSQGENDSSFIVERSENKFQSDPTTNQKINFLCRFFIMKKNTGRAFFIFYKINIEKFIFQNYFL